MSSSPGQPGILELLEHEVRWPGRALVRPFGPGLIGLGLEGVDVADRVGSPAGRDPAGEPVACHDVHLRRQAVVATELVVRRHAAWGRSERHGVGDPAAGCDQDDEDGDGEREQVGRAHGANGIPEAMLSTPTWPRGAPAPDSWSAPTAGANLMRQPWSRSPDAASVVA